MDTLNKIDYNLLEQLIEQYHLPLHIIYLDRITANVTSFRSVADKYYPPTMICFAIKSNPCRGAVRAMGRLNLGADAVSEYELQTALEEHIPPANIICNGNAKTDDYIRLALRSGALMAADNHEELQRIDQLAQEIGSAAPVVIRLAGMPLQGLTAADQSTASSWTKFGFAINDAGSLFQTCQTLTHLEIVGLSAHIGTQIADPKGYDRLWELLFEVAGQFRSQLGEIKYINIGGGFPVCYLSRVEWEQFTTQLRRQLSGELPPSQWVTWDNMPLGYAHRADLPLSEKQEWIGKAYWSPYPGARMLERFLTAERRTGKTTADQLAELGDPTLIVEPGRSLIGTAGITIATVTAVKWVMGNPLVVVDLGIVNHGTNLVAPDIFPMEIYPPQTDDEPMEAFIAGRLCFTGDMISKIKVSLNRLPRRGDLLIIHHTGAYSADHFASNSCGFPRPAKVAIKGSGEVEVWRHRERYEDVW